MGRSVLWMLVLMTLSGCAGLPLDDVPGQAPGHRDPPQDPDRRSAGAPERTEGTVEVDLEGTQFRASQRVTYRNDVVADVASVAVSIGAGSLDVVPSNSAGYLLEIELYGRGPTQAEARANLEGLRERHTETRGLSLETAVERISGTNHGALVKLTIPQALYFESLELDTGSADITVSGLAGAAFSLDSGSGDQELTALAALRLSIDAGSGDVDATRVAADTLSIDTGSGAIRYDGRVGAVSTDSGSGRQQLDLQATRAAQWTFAAGSGSITVAASGGSYDVQASNGSGGIDLDVSGADPVGKQDDDAQHVRSRGFADAAVKVTMALETGSGDIRVTA